MTQSKFITTNNIQLHYLEYGHTGPVIVLMHGLTANAHCFDGLIAAGLAEKYRIITVDLRGRGLSDQPDEGYTMADHALDIIGLLDSLGHQKVILGGHSFGALLTLYMAKHYPERVEKMLLIDAAARLHPDTREMLKPTLSRLEQSFVSFEDYLGKIRQMPFLEEAWSDTMLSYYQADVLSHQDGTVTPRSQARHMLAAVEGALGEPWMEYLSGIPQPGILINATGAYGAEGAPPLLPKDLALETVQSLPNCRYQEVSGNHQTMLYEQGATEILKTIRGFI
ncbi:MAG TPA: alpha/beta hydrolase [Microscillaceae bacterium]|nr:alpha/beta hydrolase [Microscillaceae bacterium]